MSADVFGLVERTCGASRHRATEKAAFTETYAKQASKSQTLTDQQRKSGWVSNEINMIMKEGISKGAFKRTWEVIKDSGIHSYHLRWNPEYADISWAMKEQEELAEFQSHEQQFWSSPTKLERLEFAPGGL